LTVPTAHSAHARRVFPTAGWWRGAKPRCYFTCHTRVPGRRRRGARVSPLAGRLACSLNHHAACPNTQAPRLDLVPLFPTCGWSLHTASCLADVASVVVAPHGRGRQGAGGQLSACDDVAEQWDEHTQSSDVAVMAAVQAARAAAGLRPLPVHRLPPPPPRRGALPPTCLGSTAADDVAAEEGNGGGIAQNGAHGAAPSHGDADEDGGDGSGQDAAAWCYDAVAVGGTFDRLHGASSGLSPVWRMSCQMHSHTNTHR
jgi:hypothetical protein